MEWAMSPPLPSGDFEKLDNSQFTTKEIIEDISMIPDDNESGFIVDCDSEYPVEITEKQLHCDRIKQKQIQGCLHFIRIV